MTEKRGVVGLLGLTVLTGVLPAQSTEKAESSLPVRGGLVLNLDASDQARLRQALSVPPVVNLQSADAWYGSEGGEVPLQAVQPLQEHRPVRMESGEAAFFRFDGKDDFLALSGPRRLTPAVTVFVLAAPKANAGNFSAMFSTAANGANDYTSGLNLDQGPTGTPDLSVLSVESAGGSGFKDLLVPAIMGAAERPFGQFHVLTVRSQIGKDGTELFFDGFKAGSRDRLESNIGLDHITIGARRYSNDMLQLPYVQGCFQGDIAAVLVYDRALTDAERESVEQYLMKRTAGLHALTSGKLGHTLETLQDPPVVQMLVPGFSVRELPLKTGNLNNVRYRADGKVVALGYDGRIHLLSDTDGDGLEDSDVLYWDKTTMRGAIGMEITPPGDPRGPGVFVASKGKVSFFPDKNGDDRADEERVVATGWKETFHGVDTLGLALDPKDGALYFGMGCSNFADAYLIDKNTGRSQYDIRSERGTIQRLSADFTQRETICSGVRFTCALAFNRDGDLFATEQEGATWLPNGNPFDELLHIQRGKHYGFPPRHPKHLPDAVDHPAVFEYGPQHQSAVGMVFNEGVNGGPSFGPAHWKSDAIVCGESRGKLWRTKLATTPRGYVAQTHLIACLGMLLVDACVTPEGDLLLACHGGPPDWGTGPAGQGRLFKLRHQQKEVPQPVMAWAAAADEFRIAFDRPLDPADWKEALAKVRIEAGPFVAAGDRYETVRPGYQAVRDQMATPRRWVQPLGLVLSADQRTLVLQVPRQTEPVTYAVTLPVPERWRPRDGDGKLSQNAEMDVALTLHGLEARLSGGDTRVVLPHPSAEVSRVLTQGSADHAGFFVAVKATGQGIVVDGGVNASNPFVPSVQPGSKLDWEPDKDPFCRATFDVCGDEGRSVLAPASPGQAGYYRLEKVKLSAGSGLHLAHGGLEQVLSPQRVYVPWADFGTEEKKRSAGALAETRQDVKGSWLAGRRLFFGEAGCFTCHTVRGEGKAYGPDLTNLIHRDRESVVRDLAQPSATLNPDHTGSTVVLKDGTKLAGLVHRSEAGPVLGLALPGGVRMELAREKIVAVEPLKVSLMPEGLWQRLHATKQEDLLTFLLVNPLEPATITRLEPAVPPARTAAELVAHLPDPPDAERRARWKPLRILLAAGDKDHGVDEHDYPLWSERWARLLALADGVNVETCMGFPEVAKLEAADLVVFYSRNQGWDLKSAAQLDEYQQRGGGLVYLHYGIEGGRAVPALAERAGLAFSASAFRHGEMDLVFPDAANPITRGFSKLRLVDESYWRLHGDAKRLGILATTMEQGAAQPQLWTLERHKGRVFGCIPGHYTWTFDDPLYRLLVLRGIAWASRQEDVDRFSELATVGARVVSEEKAIPQER